MSEYNPETGIYELTKSKADSYYNKPHDESIKAQGIDYYAELLKRAGLKVISVHEDSLRVKANQVQLWEVLSDEPPAWEILLDEVPNNE
ncbi:hypothetical protein [Microcoleus sp. FACHB-68]|uniref:hypothetical protein n=1 Tax=Microcoleus sp. FACHB-68 TaxID=2692826 RepID=UPI001686AACC|nr:hypothetical protein [Microcoleus sp. FACHB-68]MBD1938565.1 hypothetical protein [Microcoleus sp. FACHB-68]